MARKPQTNIWLWLHRYMGLATLAFLAIAAVTGCILCFAKPLDAALNADLFKTKNSGEQISPIAAVEAFQAEHPDLFVHSFPLKVREGRNILVQVEPKPSATIEYENIFLDGVTGEVVGGREGGPGWGRRHFVEGMLFFHYTLLGGNWGRWIMGVAALGWFAGNLIGFYLTFPKRGPFWANWKKFWTISFRGPPARFLLDLHRASGLWVLIGVTVLAFTSVAMNFFFEAFTPAVQAVSPAKPSPWDAPAPQTAPNLDPIDFAGALEKGTLWVTAERPAWKPAKMLTDPERDLVGVLYTRNGYENYSGLGPIFYWMKGRTGEFVYEDNPYRDSAGRKLSRSLYPLHSGEIAGWFGVAIIFLLGLATTEMCVSGLYVWWRKRGPRIAQKKAARKSAPQKAATGA